MDQLKRVLVGVVLIVLQALGCSAKSIQAATQAEAFAVASPTPASETYEQEYVGEIQAVQHVELRARMKGFIESVAVDEGQRVKKGQLLFAISAREIQQELQKARAVVAGAMAGLASAQIELANTKVLFEKKIISQGEFAQSNSKVQSLSAKLDEAKADEVQAEINLSYAQVRAPFDGIVNRIPKKAGSIIAEGDLLTTLANTDEVYVYFRLSESEYLDYTATADEQRSKEVTLKLANGELYPEPGRIDAVESEFSKETGNIAFRARFPNDRNTLKHGSSGKVVVSTKVHNGLIVPQKSTFEIQEHIYVYVLDADDKTRATRIEPKLRLKDTFVVDAGLTTQDRFVLEGVQRIRDGDKITVSPATLLRNSAL